MIKHNGLRSGRHRSVTGFVAKARRAAAPVFFMAGVVKVVEAAMAVWDRMIGWGRGSGGSRKRPPSPGILSAVTRCSLG
jgi:hypothetical protein